MNENDRTEQLLSQILDTQRAHLEEYKRVTTQSLELQRQGVETQSRHVRLYRQVIFIGAIVMAGLVACVFWLMSLVR